MKLVEKLRRSGNKVKVEHFRYQNGNLVRYTRHTKGEVETHGGYTRVTFTTKSGRSAVGVARCSNQDVFCYAEGVRRALQDANKNLKEVRSDGKVRLNRCLEKHGFWNL